MRGSDGSSHESKSMKYVSKSSSSKHSLLSARLREHQKQAELVAREEALTKKQVLEDSKMQILQQQEALAIKTELEVSKARSKVLEQFEEDSNPSQRNIIDKPPTHHQQRSNPAYEFNVPILQDDSSSMISRISESRSPIVLQRKRDFEVHEVQAASKYQHRPQTTSEALPRVQDRIKARSSNSVKSDHSSSSAEDIMHSVARQLKKPHVEVGKFSGDPLKYKQFVRQFEARIVANTDDDDERLTYLDHYTTGEPNKIVCSLSYLDSSVAYSAIWHELNERYGDSDVIATTFINKALKWPFIHPNDVKALDEYSIFLCECQHAVSSLDSLKSLSTLIISKNFSGIYQCTCMSVGDLLLNDTERNANNIVSATLLNSLNWKQERQITQFMVKLR